MKPKFPPNAKVQRKVYLPPGPCIESDAWSYVVWSVVLTLIRENVLMAGTEDLGVELSHCLCLRVHYSMTDGESGVHFHGSGS